MFHLRHERTELNDTRPRAYKTPTNLNDFSTITDSGLDTTLTNFITPTEVNSAAVDLFEMANQGSILIFLLYKFLNFISVSGAKIISSKQPKIKIPEVTLVEFAFEKHSNFSPDELEKPWLVFINVCQISKSA